MKWQLKKPVGLTNAGTQCPNIALDQQQVAELLDAVARLPFTPPLRRHEGTPIEQLPPIEDGFASPELCEAIRRFQVTEGDLIADSRVDVDGPTWRRLLSITAPDVPTPQPQSIMLSLRDLLVRPLPVAASGLPSFTYSIKGQPIAVFENHQFIVEFSAVGPIKVSWQEAYPIACTVSPNFAILDASLLSGAASLMDATQLKNLCSQMQVESKMAVGDLFSGIALKMGPEGPVISGSISSKFSGFSVSFSPIERAIIYDGEILLLEERLVTGGQAKLSGKLRASIKIKTKDDYDEAGMAASIAVLLIGIIVLTPTIVGLGARMGAALPAAAEAITDGVTEVVGILSAAAKVSLHEPATE